MHAHRMRYPKEIILEVTNMCNLKCKFCHFHGEDAQIRRKLGFMAPEVWGKLLEEIRQWDEPCTIFTHGAGEPLLYLHLEELLTSLGDIPKIHTGFMTNGMLLTPEISRMLVALQLNSLALSIDGVFPETHDYFRKNANLKQIERNVQYLIAEKERAGSPFPCLAFNMVGYPDILDQEEAYVKKWLPHADSVMISKFRPVGSRKLWDDADSPSFMQCPLLYTQAVISIEGDVGLCCEDINLDVPVGNILRDELLSLYNNSSTLQRYRNAHENKEIGQLKLCSDCHVWGSHIILEKYKKTMGKMKAVCHVSPSGKVYRKL